MKQKSPKTSDEGRERRRERRATSGSKDQPERSEVREWIKSGVFAIVLFFLMRAFLIQTFVITSGSMENTLLVGDYLIVNRAAIGSKVPFLGLRIPGYSEARRGDVLVFDPPHEPELKLVKRLVGMPGDTIEMRNKALYINGTLQDEPYVQHVDASGDERHPWMSWQADHLAPGVERDGYRPTRDNWGPLVVPPEHYFMLGDNRDTSLDSRYWGLLEAHRLEGRASRIYYSYDKESIKPFRFIRDVRAERVGAAIR